MSSDSEAQASSRQLQGEILQSIKQEGALSFSQFMQMALYHPRWGYYTGPSYKFGEKGDFVTAPELGPLFARCLARQSFQILQHLGNGNILEFGAGSGRMAVDILLELEALDCLPEKYYILEASGNLRFSQQQTVKQQLPHLASRVHWVEQLHTITPFKGVILANEVLDAIPVHRFIVGQESIREMRVDHRQDWQWVEAEFSEPLQSRCEDILHSMHLTPGYQSELHFIAEDWLRTLAESLQQGSIILIDYGFPDHEYYHEQRSSGTLMCHYQHRSHTDVFANIGLQDITSHVNFSTIANVGEKSGLELAGYTSQAYFLISNGLEQVARLDQISDHRQQIEMSQNIKKLTLPNEMGELFKVIAFNKFIDLKLQGFDLYDHRHKL